MILGAIVIIVVGFLIVNYFRNVEDSDILPPMESIGEVTLPTTHIVSGGEDLWSISETYYKTGYNWVDISKANNLENPGVITTGQELIIPDVEPKVSGEELAENLPTSTSTPVPTKVIVTTVPTIPASPKPKQIIGEQAIPGPTKISGDSYTVVKGDNLWNIAVRTYGDGFRWVDIARANKLVNPDLIHPGNVFVLPR